MFWNPVGKLERKQIGWEERVLPGAFVDFEKCHSVVRNQIPQCTNGVLALHKDAMY